MTDAIEYEVIEAGPEWADKYRQFCREAYLTAYVRPDLGITAEQFSENVFNSPRVIKYFQDALNIGDDHKAWLAISDDEVLGGVVGYIYGDYCELQTFYVKAELRGHGIGHALYAKILEFAHGLPIQIDVVEYMQDTIDMYRHWGFEIDASKGKVIYDWVEWPQQARQAYKGIYMVKPGRKA